ncbi:MAG: hypothetical protein WBA68_08580 [Alteraurantiacibacter sp.]
MTSLATRLLAATLSLASIAATPAPISPYYEAELAAPTDETRAIAGGVVFACEGNVCRGPQSNSRDLRVCSQLRREVGPIASFTVRAEAMSEADLARCNG